MSGWIGVDLDGTLARYDGWRGIDHIGEPMPRHDAGHAADAWAYLRTRPDQHTATLREALKEAAQSEVVGVCYLDTGPYHATSPKEDATCLNLSAGSPVSSA